MSFSADEVFETLDYVFDKIEEREIKHKQRTAALTKKLLKEAEDREKLAEEVKNLRSKKGGATQVKTSEQLRRDLQDRIRTRMERIGTPNQYLSDEEKEKMKKYLS